MELPDDRSQARGVRDRVARATRARIPCVAQPPEPRRSSSNAYFARKVANPATDSVFRRTPARIPHSPARMGVSAAASHSTVGDDADTPATRPLPTPLADTAPPPPNTVDKMCAAGAASALRSLTADESRWPVLIPLLSVITGRRSPLAVRRPGRDTRPRCGKVGNVRCCLKRPRHRIRRLLQAGVVAKRRSVLKDLPEYLLTEL